MKAPVGLSSRQSGLRSKCRVFGAARTGIHEKGAAGRGPNSSSLFPPLAAVVAVAHFSHFSDLRLRRWCYLSADGKVLLKPEIFGEAVKRRRLKMRLRDLRANARISSILSWSPPLRDYQGRVALDSCLPRLESSGHFSGSLLVRKRELSPA